ncbi:hypothetical protein ECG_05189 [Echinococcus granulosus]|uniref:Expressed conserved protein n=1 Tax=Echinococcus granulosus TaxID=6210 RepID=U6J256_ECHGR|nr:hypothetical protein EGR_03682 [Echinococcus granulosus]EUB61392.1 hypothetical protein EGR_03682 [Echinococcus granulosus]KAH9282196.1 hypothetical protein ECG_05189 [Echinococcus granulosus]CDS18088.1 expressed conserved protein [Echinococcus granulosus]
MGRRCRYRLKKRRVRRRRTSLVQHRQCGGTVSNSEVTRKREQQHQREGQQQEQRGMQEQQQEISVLHEFEELARQEVSRVFQMLYNHAELIFDLSRAKFASEIRDKTNQFVEYEEERFIRHRFRIDNQLLQEAINRMDVKESEYELRYFLNMFKSDDLVAIDLLFREPSTDPETGNPDREDKDPYTEDTDQDAEDKGSDEECKEQEEEDKYSDEEDKEPDAEDKGSDEEDMDPDAEDYNPATEDKEPFRIRN